VATRGLQLLARFVASAIPLLLGVTLLGFVLMVYLGPDQTYSLLGKNPTPEQIQEVRHQLGYDRPFPVRYAEYLRQLATLDLGHSQTSGESVRGLLGHTLPVSLALLLPPFLVGHLLAIALALAAVARRGRLGDRLIMGMSVVGMSLSYVVIVIGMQTLFSSSNGLGWFPVRGWSSGGLASYLYHEAVPALCVTLVTLGYNTRFYRAVFAEAVDQPHVRAARSFGAGGTNLMLNEVLRPSLGPVITQVLYSLPLIVVGGSLLIESYFGIPGVGRVTFDAIVNGDQPVLKAVVGLTAVLFLLARLLADALQRLADPRVS